MSFSDAQLDDLKGRIRCHEIAAKWVSLRKSGKAWIGPCPLCSRNLNKKTATKFKATDTRWMCAACMDGGDVIELVRKYLNKTFTEAVEWLGGAREIDSVEAERKKAESDKKRMEDERVAAEFREKARGTAYDIWRHGVDPAGTSVERYFAVRGLAGAPMTALRCIEDMPYYDGGAKDAPVIHRGPAMLAPYLRDGKFAALHITYLDLDRPNGKLKLPPDPDGEERPAKKMRGPKSAALITLASPPDGIAPRRAFIGEGLETVLSVWCALSALGRRRETDAFYMAGDIGNLGGPSSESVPHPTLKSDAGRIRRVPGPWPEVGSPSIVLPESVTDAILLGDGDSEPFFTRCHLARASIRLAAPGRRVVVAMAPEETDFNDVWRASRDAAAVCALIEAAAPLTPEDVMGTAAAAPTRDSAANSASRGNAAANGGDDSPSTSPDVFPADTNYPEDDAPFSSSAAAAPPFAQANERQPSRPGEFTSRGRPGTRSANRARWDGPPNKYGDGDAALNRWLAFFPMTELGLIERFVQRQKGRLKYCEAIGWLLWTGKVWTRVGAHGAAISAGHEVVRAIQDEAESIRDTEFDQIVALKPAKKKGDDEEKIRLSDLLESFGRASETKAKMTLHDHAEPYISVEVDQLDADPYAINLLNGTLVARRIWDGPLPAGWRQVNPYIRLKPHDQDDLITKIMPVSFDAAAQCPLYDKFMDRVQPVPEVRDFIDDWNGYSLTGDATEQKLVFNFGTGKNGKSTERSVRQAIVGDYGRSIPIETFVNEGKSRSGGQATPELAMLRRVRMLATSEPEKGWKLNEALIKALTGGEQIAVRELHKPFFMLIPEFKLTIDGNFKPNIGGGEAESGMWRRMVLVPWNIRISKAEQDPHLVDKLKLEASGILNRWLAGLSRWMQRKLKLPDEVTKATEEFRVDSDPLGRFMTECTEPDEGGRIQATTLHNLFVAWARATGEVGRHDWTATGFGRAMSERGYIRIKSDLTYWVNLKLTKSINDFVDHEGKPLTPKETPSRDAQQTGAPSRTEAWPDDDDVQV